MKKVVGIFLTMLLSAQAAVPNVLAQAPTLKQLRTRQRVEKASKLAPDLEELLEQDDAQNRTGLTLAQLRQNGRALTVSSQTARQRGRSVLPAADIAAEATQSFIVQVDGATPEITLQEKLASLGGRISRKLEKTGLLVVEAPRSTIRQIAADTNIAYVSPDRPVTATGHVSATTGWDNTGISDKGDADVTTWLAGGWGSVAVIDSGVDANHNLLVYTQDGGGQKVTFNKDFTGQNINGDPYGHGTHVASMMAGDWAVNNALCEAVAPGSNILSLRALDSNGSGTVSNVIAALDWCVTNKDNYDIRVINLSLGTPAKDSYKNDPLCLAARRAWNAGIVVVCSAGNVGKDANGNKVYGGINSPGIEPSIITVGAANTYGTTARSDDTVATFSSRGPTRGYVTVNGVKKYDNLIKPDLIAPGNKLIGARGYYAGAENKLVQQNTSLRTGSTTVTANKLMYLSGTSMAAPIVTGTVELLIETNPNLTPNMIKAILMYTAQPLKNFNTLEQGAGELNVDGAVRLARLIKPTLPTTNGTALLTAALPATQASTIGGKSCAWGKGVISNYSFLYGNELMTKWQGMYANGVVLGDSLIYSSGVLIKSPSLTTTGVTMSQGPLTNNGIVLGEGTLFVNGVVLGDGTMANGIALGDGVVLGEGVALGDCIAQASLGDNTACMPPAP